MIPKRATWFDGFRERMIDLTKICHEKILKRSCIYLENLTNSYFLDLDFVERYTITMITLFSFTDKTRYPDSSLLFLFLCLYYLQNGKLLVKLTLILIFTNACRFSFNREFYISVW